MLPRVTALLTGLGFCALANAAPTHYPLTLENCGNTLLNHNEVPTTLLPTPRA